MGSSSCRAAHLTGDESRFNLNSSSILLVLFSLNFFLRPAHHTWHFRPNCGVPLIQPIIHNWERPDQVSVTVRKSRLLNLLINKTGEISKRWKSFSSELILGFIFSPSSLPTSFSIRPIVISTSSQNVFNQFISLYLPSSSNSCFILTWSISTRTFIWWRLFKYINLFGWFTYKLSFAFQYGVSQYLLYKFTRWSDSFNSG